MLQNVVEDTEHLEELECPGLCPTCEQALTKCARRYNDIPVHQIREILFGMSLSCR